MPDGIDPGWDHNPGLSRARTLLRATQARLDEAGPDIARRAVAEIVASPMPEVIASIPLPERAHLPVAVSPSAARALDARSPIIMASNDTLSAKAAKHGHAGITPGEFARVQDVIDTGTMIDERKEGQIAFFQRIDIANTGGPPALYKVVLGRSAGGYMRVRTFFRGDAQRLRKSLRDAGIWSAADESYWTKVRRPRIEAGTWTTEDQANWEARYLTGPEAG